MLPHIQTCFSGIDESVDPRDLLPVMMGRPHDEMLGVLLASGSLKGAGIPRYPSIHWICKALLPYSGFPLRLVLHLCGDLADEAVSSFHTFVRRLPDGFLPHFEAVQLNLDAPPAMADAKDFLVGLRSQHIQRAIFQAHNDATLAFVQELRLAAPASVAVVFDPSRGTGSRPATRPVPVPFMACGYAGGINPRNASQEIRSILDMALAEGRTSAHDLWIDLETGLRSTLGARDWFDLDKLLEVRDAAINAEAQFQLERRMP